MKPNQGYDFIEVLKNGAQRPALVRVSDIQSIHEQGDHRYLIFNDGIQSMGVSNSFDDMVAKVYAAMVPL